MKVIYTFLAVSGILCYLVALLSWSASYSWDITVFFFLILGFVLNLIFIFLCSKSLAQFLRSFQGKYFLKYLFSAVLASFVWGVSVYTLSTFELQTDLSTQKIHTLSDTTKEYLEGLDEKVELYYLHIPKALEGESKNKIILSLKKYASSSDLIDYKIINTVNKPDALEKFGLNSQEEGLFAVTQSKKYRFFDTSEESITSALVSVRKPKRKFIFIKGNGENSPLEEKSSGLSAMKKELERFSYEVLAVDHLSEVSYSKEDILLTVSADRAIAVSTQKALQEHYAAGGRVVYTVDPLNSEIQEPFLKTFGVTVHRGSLLMNPPVFSAPHLVGGLVNPTVKGLKGVSEGNKFLLFYIVTGIKKLAGLDAEYISLIRTPEETELRDGFVTTDTLLDTSSFDIAVQLVNQKKGELFLFGDGDFITNQFLYKQNNPLFLFHFTRWITGDNLKISIRESEIKKSQFLATAMQFKLFLILFAIPLPIFLFMFALLFWWKEKKQRKV